MQVRFRFHLRLVFLLMALLCISIAWLKYRAVISHYDAQVHQINISTRLALVESRIEATRHRLNSEEPLWQTRDMQSRLSFQLLREEAEKAMCELELTGFRVSWPNTRGPQAEITVGPRSLVDEELREFLGRLEIIGRYHLGMVVRLEGARLGDVDRVVSDIKDICPTCEVKR